MSRYLPKPGGLWRLERAFPKGYANRQCNPVTVSLCGPLERVGVVLEADPDKDYDWSALRCFYVAVAVRKGIDATRTIKALVPVAAPYVLLVDADTGDGASILGLTPKLTVWKHSASWLDAFARALEAA
jgi:hypothetical protein